MATWTALASQVQAETGDATGVFHDAVNVKNYLFQAELLLSTARALTEVTGTLTIAGQWAYEIHSIFQDLIRPLRIIVNDVVLTESSLENVSLLDPMWPLTTGQPEMWFMIGGTFLSFYPVPGAGTATILYLGVPSTTGTSPTVQANWQQVLTLFAEAVALGKETQLTMAQDKMKQFVEAMGIRDIRLLDPWAVKPGKETATPVRAAND